MDRNGREGQRESIGRRDGTAGPKIVYLGNMECAIVIGECVVRFYEICNIWIATEKAFCHFVYVNAIKEMNLWMDGWRNE